MEAASSRFLRSSVRSTSSWFICSRAPFNLTDCILWLSGQLLTYWTERHTKNRSLKLPCLARNMLTLAERTVVWYKEQLCQSRHKQMSPARQQQNNNCTLFGIIILWSFHLGLILHIICLRSSLDKPIMLEGWTTQKLTKQTKKYNINTNLTNSSQCTLFILQNRNKAKKIGKVCSFIQ